MCVSFSCWSDCIRGKCMGVLPETCWFCWIAICPFRAICLQKNVICVRHFPVDLMVSEAKVRGWRQKPVDLLNCNLSISSNLSSKKFHMCVSFSCWSDSIRGKGMGVLPETCWFCWIAICPFLAICLRKNVICVRHFLVDLIVSEANVRGCRQKPVDFVELQFVRSEQFVFEKISYVCVIFLLIR